MSLLTINIWAPILIGNVVKQQSLTVTIILDLGSWAVGLAAASTSTGSSPHPSSLCIHGLGSGLIALDISPKFTSLPSSRSLGITFLNHSASLPSLDGIPDHDPRGVSWWVNESNLTNCYKTWISSPFNWFGESPLSKHIFHNFLCSFCSLYYGAEKP